MEKIINFINDKEILIFKKIIKKKQKNSSNLLQFDQAVIKIKNFQVFKNFHYMLIN